jgi:hypothetical protein
MQLNVKQKSRIEQERLNYQQQQQCQHQPQHESWSASPNI